MSYISIFYNVVKKSQNDLDTSTFKKSFACLKKKLKMKRIDENLKLSPVALILFELLKIIILQKNFLFRKIL